MELEELLPKALERIFAILAPLRAARVIAGPVEQLALERRIEGLEAAAGELEALLAGLADLLTCCPAAEARVRDLLAEEVRLRAAHAESADEAERLRYEARIAEARAQRDGLAREQFERVLRALDFVAQRRDFKRRIDADRLASVLIQGDDGHGLYWLSHRLRDLVRPANPVTLRHSFGAGAVDQTLPGLLQGLARQLRLPPRLAPGELAGCVLDAIARRWSQQSVVLLLDRVELLGPAGLQAILDGLWSPLCDAILAAPRPLARTCIAAFLLHHTSAPGGASPAGEQGAPPRAPLPMRLSSFDEGVLAAWVDAHLEGGIPGPLHDPETRRHILQRCGGVPCDVVDDLSRTWPSDWYSGSNIQNEWFQP